MPGWNGWGKEGAGGWGMDVAAGRLFAQPAERRAAPSNTKAARGVRPRGPQMGVPMGAPDAALFRFRLNFGFEVGRDSRQGFGHTAQRLGGLTPSGWADFTLGYPAKPFQFAIEFTADLFKFCHRSPLPRLPRFVIWQPLLNFPVL